MVVLLTKVAGNPKPLPAAVILAVTLIEVGVIFYYMSSLEAPVP
jgi:hypothetical protein